MTDDSTALLSIDLANRITASNLCAIAISSHSVATGLNLVCDLCRKNVADRTILIYHTEGLPVHFNDTSNSGSIKLDEIMNIVDAELSIGSHLSRKSKILAENCDLLHTHIAKKSDGVILDLHDHTQFVLISTAADNLDVITFPESFTESSNRRVDCLTGQLALGDLQ